MLKSPDNNEQDKDLYLNANTSFKLDEKSITFTDRPNETYLFQREGGLATEIKVISSRITFDIEMSCFDKPLNLSTSIRLEPQRGLATFSFIINIGSIPAEHRNAVRLACDYYSTLMLQKYLQRYTLLSQDITTTDVKKNYGEQLVAVQTVLVSKDKFEITTKPLEANGRYFYVSYVTPGQRNEKTSLTLENWAKMISNTCISYMNTLRTLPTGTIHHLLN